MVLLISTIREKWINVWIPRMKEYINTQNPAEKADIVVDYKEIPEVK